MTSAVLDASAVLALIRAETGAEAVLPHVGTGAIGAVNLQEVVKVLLADGLEIDAARATIAELRLDIVPHDAEAAYAAAALGPATARHGSGLGDRSCMALGLALGLPVLTADRDWQRIDLPGLLVEVIR